MRAGWEAVLCRPSQTVPARWHLGGAPKEPDRPLESKYRQSKQVRRPEGPGRDVRGDHSGCIREVRCLAFPLGEMEKPRRALGRETGQLASALRAHWGCWGAGSEEAGGE